MRPNSSRSLVRTGADAGRMRKLTPAAEHERILDRWTEQPGRITGFWIPDESYAGQRNGGTPANFSFVPASSCFPSSTGETIAFTATENSNGRVTGNFAMSISTLFPGALNKVLSSRGAGAPLAPSLEGR
jgi:hypothetical protein